MVSTANLHLYNEDEASRALWASWGEPSPGLEFEKCYDRARDGGNSYTFHTKCDNKGPTITFMRLGTVTLSCPLSCVLSC